MTMIITQGGYVTMAIYTIRIPPLIMGRLLFIFSAFVTYTIASAKIPLVC